VIRLAVPSIDDLDVAAVAEVLRTGMLVQGANVAAFEELVADRCGTRHAVAVSSGTAALHVALLAAGVGPGDAVAVPTYSWPATANVVVLAGARPVFIDIDPSTFAMDPARLADVLARERVRVVLPVHPFGLVAPMRELTALAEEHGASVVEDAACALAASHDGRPAGSWGAQGCFSFHPRKAVTTGEGGVVSTDDASLARAARVLRNHGLDPDSPSPDFVVAGFNYRMTEFQAALGRTQLAKLDEIVTARRAGAARYTDLLSGTDIVAPLAPNGTKHVYQSYVVLLPADVAPHRASVIARLRDQGVETTIGTYHQPMTSFFRRLLGHRPGDFPVTDDVVARALSLPLFPQITAEQQAAVAEAVVDVVAAHRAATVPS
jgi:dTDP-4-amino-4,6-dideoxygalactose transaminase